MPKTIYESTVAGRVAFPIDMLRYDRCFPATEQDSVQIGHSLDRRLQASDGVYPAPLRSVRVISERLLTSARWESFGWLVDNIATRRV